MAGGDAAGQARRWAFRGAAAGALLVAAILWMPTAWLDDSLRGSAFDSARWKAVPPGYAFREDNPRRSMVHDLVTRVGLKGKTENEVRDLLGPGTTWSLGPTRQTMGSHQDFFRVVFDEAGRVRRVEYPGAW
jgi:hypothetical protein